MGYHVNIMQCMQPNFLLTGRVYPMLMSSVPRAWGTLDRKSTLFKLILKFFLKSVVFMLWHDIVYIELLYCVTNFELVWTWNKVTVVENAKKCRLYPTFPYISCGKVGQDLWKWLRVKERSQMKTAFTKKWDPNNLESKLLKQHWAPVFNSFDAIL